MDEQNKKVVQRMPFQAQPGKHYDEKSILSFADAIKAKLDKKRPGHSYRMVRIGTGRFRFVWGRDFSTPAKGN